MSTSFSSVTNRRECGPLCSLQIEWHGLIAKGNYWLHSREFDAAANLIKIGKGPKMGMRVDTRRCHQMNFWGALRSWKCSFPQPSSVAQRSHWAYRRPIAVMRAHAMATKKLLASKILMVVLHGMSIRTCFVQVSVPLLLGELNLQPTMKRCF